MNTLERVQDAKIALADIKRGFTAANIINATYDGECYDYDKAREMTEGFERHLVNLLTTPNSSLPTLTRLRDAARAAEFNI